MKKELVNFLIKEIKSNGFKKILECGSGIGYTSIQIALLGNTYVDTFEYYMPRYEVCKENINEYIKKVVQIFTILFTLFMVIGRLLAGVHWLTDIIGSVLLSSGLLLLYVGCAESIINRDIMGGDKDGIS